MRVFCYIIFTGWICKVKNGCKKDESDLLACLVPHQSKRMEDAGNSIGSNSRNIKKEASN